MIYLVITNTRNGEKEYIGRYLIEFDGLVEEAMAFSQKYVDGYADYDQQETVVSVRLVATKDVGILSDYIGHPMTEQGMRDDIEASQRDKEDDL